MAEEREPCTEVVIGGKGTGKTWRAVMNIYRYLQVHHNRKVIIFDVNDEVSYRHFKIIDPDLIPKLKKVATVRRVPSYNVHTGAPLDLDEKAQMCFYLLSIIRNGLFVVEDMNNYMTVSTQKGFLSKLTTNRHSDLDLEIHLQSASAITPRLWQNHNYLRFHYTPENIARIKKNVPDYDLYRLAQIILEIYYRAGFRRKFIYIDTQMLKFIGISIHEETEPCELVQVSPQEFAQACAVHLDKPLNSKEVQAYIAKKLYYIT